MMSDIPQPQPPNPVFDRALLDGLHREPLKAARSVVGPDVWLVEYGGRRYVVKDFSARTWLLRNTWGRTCVSREVAAYSRLLGVPGVPQLVGRPDPFSFVMEFVEGAQLPRRSQRDLLGPGFFPALQALVAEMHRRGVAHGDLRRRNILVTPDRRPALIDFETAVVARRVSPSGWFFRTMARVDDLKLLKIRHKYYRGQTTGEEMEALENPPVLLRIGRFLRRRLYKPISPKASRARRERKP